MHFWARTYDTFDTGATLITYTNMSAFKFPDRMQVYLTCNVQVSDVSCSNTQQDAWLEYTQVICMSCQMKLNTWREHVTKYRANELSRHY